MQPYRTDWTQLDQVIEELPPGIPILPREDAGNIEKYANRPPRVFSAGECWRDCARLMERYDGALCKGYQEEMDTLLVFAGLFSAVVTAFIVESYQWLQEDASDKIILLLAQIAQSTSSNSSSRSEALISSSSSLPRPVSIRINACWFLALSLALSAALFAMLCKQWVREFGRQTDCNPIDRVTIRQMRGISRTVFSGR